MKLTKKMENLIDRRVKLAIDLAAVSNQIDDFISDNGMEGEVDDCDWLTGCAIYCEPGASGERIKEAIRNHRKGSN